MMDERFGTPVSSLDDTSLNRIQASKQATGMSGTLASTTVSNLDLRRSKGELFSKLIERQPQQMIVTTPNKTSSDDNLANTSRTTSDLSRLVGGCRKTSSKDDLADSSRDVAAQGNGLGQQQREVVTFSSTRSRWYTNEEVAGILTSFNSHPEWQTNELQVRPKSGAVLLYSREKVRYRQDGYCWKKRKNGRTTREDHMKLKVQGIECIYGCYVHSAILPTFHRRCYWLLENPDIVLVHYLNQPLDDKNKMILTFDSGVLEADTRRRWTNEEIVEEIGSVFGGISQIHHTLNINFPSPCRALNDSRPDQAEYCSGAAQTGMVDLGEFPSNNNNNRQDDSDQMDMSSADEQILSHNEFGDGGYKVQDDLNHNHLANNERVDVAESVDSRIAINLPVKKEQENDEMVVAINSSPSGLKCSQDKGNEGNNIDIKLERAGQNQTTSVAASTSSDTMPFGVSNVSDGAKVARDELMSRQQSSVDYDLIDPDVVLIGDRDDRRNLLNNSKTFYRSTTITNDCEEGERRRHQHEQQQQEQSPCSPVTQIYNKIVDDIETYVLPLEPNQFNLNHHHDDPMHQQDPSIALRTMDTSDEAAMGSHQRDANQNASHQQFVSSSTASSHYDSAILPPSDHSLALASCDLFNSCAIDEMSTVGGQLDNDPGSGLQHDGDMLLSDYNLAESDVTSSQVNNDDTLTNVDLMMAMQSTNEEHDPSVHDAQQLLINDSETLDLFSFKQSDLGGQKNQLDVKSTTSDTDTMNRLSPMIPTVPRCNSTDNALRSSFINQHLEQYQHRASNHFLHQDPPLNSFSQYNTHHNDTTIANCSATSTEPSNSTSCSASPSSSPLLTTSCGTAFGIGCSGDNTGLLLNSYMKLPLQQRQNSEQKEPSNSVLNSLLPKALSLDGSELSSHHNRLNHGHHLQHHNLRTSPLIGSHGLGRSRAEHGFRGVCGAHPNNQNLINQHLLSTTPSIYPSNRQQLPQHHYYQRPSVPSISPSHYSFDSNTANRVLINGTQYRSGSVVTGSMSSSHQQYAQQQQATVECRRMRQPLATHPRVLPVLDYVPNWAPTSGGTKVLLIGNWTSLIDSRLKTVDDVNGNSMPTSCSDSSGFSVLFGDLLVPASLIQSNVIRFYSPQHEPGFIPVKVLYKDQVVCEQVLFEITTSTESLCAAPNDNQETYIFSDSEEHKSAQLDQSISQAMDSTCIT